MKKIYLIRHGEPEFPGGIKRCIGIHSDYPLSENGRLQAKKLYSDFENVPLSKVYTSSLKRAVQTAEILSGGRWSVSVYEPLHEQDLGVWDGMAFSDIKVRYAELWEKRGEDKSLVPEGAEEFTHVAERMYNALCTLADKSEGDIAVVAHSSVNRGLICRLNGTPFKNVDTVPQSYGTFNVLTYADGKLNVNAVNCSNGCPDSNEIEEMWQKSGTPDNVREHCNAVRDTALEMAGRLPEKKIDLGLLRAACELHDLFRLEKNHAAVCADYLRSLGYLTLAGIIEPHHGSLKGENIDEAALLFLADKYCDGTNIVSIDERFEKSKRKLSTPEAFAAHGSRYDEAKKIEKLYLELANGGKDNA